MGRGAGITSNRGEHDRRKGKRLEADDGTTSALGDTTFGAALAFEDTKSLAGLRIKDASDELGPLTASEAKRRCELRNHGYT